MKYDFNLNQFTEKNNAPQKLAVAGSDKDINWSELASITIQLKDIFTTLQIPQGHPIVIYGHKEALFPAAMLACIHSNIPYIPVDKIYPKERIKKIVEI
jgi:D-alanine--poly(phosphoribitol) ligase subunit 1